MSPHSEPVHALALYLASLSAGTGPRLLLVCVAEAVMKGRIFSPSQRRLAEVLHRDARTVKRYVQVLKARGWLRVTRRGRKLTNVYALSPRLWARITGQRRSQMPRELQETLWRLGLKMGVPERTMGRRGLAAPRRA